MGKLPNSPGTLNIFSIGIEVRNRKALYFIKKLHPKKSRSKLLPTDFPGNALLRCNRNFYKLFTFSKQAQKLGIFKTDRAQIHLTSAGPFNLLTAIFLSLFPYSPPSILGFLLLFSGDIKEGFFKGRPQTRESSSKPSNKDP